MPISPQVTQKTSRGISARGRFYFICWPLIVVIVLLACYGLIVVSSAAAGNADYSITHQLTGVGIGFIAMCVCWFFDYRKLSTLIIPLLIIDALLMLSPHMPLIGVTNMGATSWVRIGGLQFQPGEPAKIVTIVLMAAVVARYRGKIDSGREYLKVLGICAVPFICIMLQPDLGSGLVICVIGAAILFVGGANRKWLILTIAAILAIVALILVTDPFLDAMAGHDVGLKNYQMNRLLVFLNPDLDPTGAGYNLKQAKIAIGSGGFLGKGLGNGTQATLGYLPEAPTDFIFCVVAEELGFVGSLGLLLLYLVLFIIVFDIASRASDLFGSLIITGIIGMWVFQILENIGMCCGIMPITGIPLPFMSYGSSFMLANFMAVGLILSVWRFRKAPSASGTKRVAGDRQKLLGR